MNQAQYETRVLRLAAERGVTLDPADVAESLPNALGEVSMSLANSPEYALGQKDWTVAIAGGTADLTTHTDMMIGTIERVVDADGLAWFRLPSGANRSDLDLPGNEFSYRYVVEKNALYARHGDGSTFPADDNVTVTANQNLTLTTLPAQWDDELIEAGFRVSQRPTEHATT